MSENLSASDPAILESPSQASDEPTPKPRSVRRNVVWYLIGNLLFSAGQWAMLVVLAKLTNPATVGLMTLARALTFPPLQFANLNLRIVLASSTTSRYHFRDYFGLRLITLPLAMIAIVVLALQGYGSHDAWIIIMVGVAGMFDGLSDVVYGVFQQTENLDRISISRSIIGVGQLTALVTIMWLTRDLLLATAALAVVSGLVFVFFDFRTARNTLRQARADRDRRFEDEESLIVRPNFDPKRLAGLFMLALPMAIVLLFNALNFNIPRYFIEHYINLEQLGIFGAMTALMQAAAMVQSAVGHSTIPRLARYYDEDASRFIKLFRKLLTIAACSMVANVVFSLLFGRLLLSLIYKPEYAAQVNVFHWLMLANGIFYLQAALRDAATAARNYRVQPWVGGLAIVAITLSSWLLIPQHGLLGAAWAVGIGMVVLTLGFGTVMAKIIRNLPRTAASS